MFQSLNEKLLSKKKKKERKKRKEEERKEKKKEGERADDAHESSNFTQVEVGLSSPDISYSGV